MLANWRLFSEDAKDKMRIKKKGIEETYKLAGAI